MKTKESEEMYLETLLVLKRKSHNVKSIDIANELGYARSSVSRGVNLLKARGFITMNQETGLIDFTVEGKSKAEKIYNRHQVLTKVLMKAGAPVELAEDNACRIEHVISDDLFEILKKYTEENN